MRTMLANPKTFNKVSPVPLTLGSGDFYVSPRGDDGAAGTIDAPFATFERARDAVRELLAAEPERKGGITVCFRHGDYPIDKTIELTPADSGRADCPVTYRAYGDGPVTITGGIKLSPDDFEPVSGEVAARLTPDARAHVMQLDLTKKYGLTKAEYGNLYAFGSNETSELYDDDTHGNNCAVFFNDVRMTLARWPNEGFLKVEGVLDMGDVESYPDHNSTFPRLGRNPRGARLVTDNKTAARMANWKDTSTVWYYGHPHLDYDDFTSPISEVDPHTHTFRTAHANRFGYTAGRTYYFFNILEELDIPGEWYLDRESGMLYIYPIGTMEDADIRIAIKDCDVMRFHGVEHVSFDSIAFAEVRRSCVIFDGNDIEFRRCVFKNVGEDGIEGHGYRNSYRCCEAYNIGKNAMYLSGGVKQTLTYANNVIDNNLVHDYSQIFRSITYGLNIVGQGNRMSHNEVYGSTAYAIGYSGNDNIIEYNILHNVATDGDDIAASYFGSSWASRGNVLRYNIIYDIGSPEHHPDGIYWDDGLSGQNAYGNLLVNIGKYAFIMGGGNGNTAVNNIIVNAGFEAFHYDDRMRDGWINHGWARGGVEPKSGFLWGTLETAPFTEEPWKSRYPVMSRFYTELDDPDNPDFPPNPAHSLIKGNLVVDMRKSLGWFADSVWFYSDIEDNAVYGFDEDPGFVDAAHGDYRLRPDAPVRELIPDFPDIPMELIGRY